MIISHVYLRANSCQQGDFEVQNDDKIVFLRGKENVPPAFKQYKNQGNASNLVQSHFGSPPLRMLESGIAPLVPRGFDPAFWGLYQPSPSPPADQFFQDTHATLCGLEKHAPHKTRPPPPSFAPVSLSSNHRRKNKTFFFPYC